MLIAIVRKFWYHVHIGKEELEYFALALNILGFLKFDSVGLNATNTTSRWVYDISPYKFHFITTQIFHLVPMNFFNFFLN